MSGDLGRMGGDFGRMGSDFGGGWVVILEEDGWFG